MHFSEHHDILILTVILSFYCIFLQPRHVLNPPNKIPHNPEYVLDCHTKFIATNSGLSVNS